MPTWLTTSIDKLWPGLDSADTAYAERMVDRAERMVKTRFSTITERITAGELDPVVVAGVIEDMVDRVMRKRARGGMDKLAYPEISMEWNDDGGAGTGSTLYLTVDELMLLAPAQTGGAFTIRKPATPSYPEVTRWSAP
ncbi:hypothetical protein ACEE90_01450 [Corynebacterium phoceense]|uniref:hypothetical protein n=1 Tax=Corynebacterium phoceense TaxID=1686286 RepID=UPI0034CE5184